MPAFLIIISEYSYLSEIILHSYFLTHTVTIVEILTYMPKYRWNLNLSCFTDFPRGWLYVLSKTA